ncbi:MAG: GAF domain-containing protein [Chitinophagales bacterium]|nr:GAF domain-containing protein [Chitinophagales bacterium]
MKSKDASVKAGFTENVSRSGFPYRSTLSFESLISKLEEQAADTGNLEAPFIEQILKTVKAIPALTSPIEDLNVVSRYRKEVDLLLSTVLPTSLMNNYTAGILVPFQPVTVYGSPQFNKMFPASANGVWDMQKLNLSKDMKELITFCGVAILEMYYHYPIRRPDVMKSRQSDAVTGLISYYQPEINAMFAKVTTLKEPKPLSEIDLSPLKDNFFDTEFWLKNFPPDTFAFSGFILYKVMDITDREMVSQLEYSLLQTGAIISLANINDIRDKFRSYFRVPELKVGIAPMLSYAGQNTMCSMESWYCLIPAEKSGMLFKHFEQSVYHKAVQQKNAYLVEDIGSLPEISPVEMELMEQGIASIIIVPVFQDEELIGAIEIASPNAGELNFMTMLKLKEILPLLSVVFQRSAKDFDTQVQATIKKHFTSIHPSVEWKFAQAALKMFSLGKTGEEVQLPPIELKDVTPIYGQVDIRGSSDQRNEAIRLDLMDYLTSANKIMLQAYRLFPLSILEEMIFRATKFMDRLQSGMDSGDETGILEFMKQEVEPTLRLMMQRNTTLKTAVENYFTAVDPEHEAYHFRRHDFERSLTMINDLVAGLLDEEETLTQQLLPHYFEKYKTDGVEYNIYLGQSILQDGTFDPLFIRNFRLWQLISMVRIARETHRLIPELPIPLETTQLILCYSNPFSIVFRMDEKRFDVAGAYNIRYEIVKKRIDKAYIKGSNERLTQPHKVAIIYTQEREAKEYERYFEFLQEKGWISGMIERLEVEPLQGLHGLKALRVEVLYDAADLKLNLAEELLFREVKDAIA